jgi:hypothetical protein
MAKETIFNISIYSDHVVIVLCLHTKLYIEYYTNGSARGSHPTYFFILQMYDIFISYVHVYHFIVVHQV